MFNNIITPFLLGTEPGLKKIRKKENFHNCEKYEKLDEDDDPEPFANGHIPEAFVIESEDSDKYVSRCHTEE